MIPFTGYLMALLVGLCLGLLGSGGSILTVPVLVYLFRLDPVTGTSYSLFIVGVTSLAGLALGSRIGLRSLRAGLTFAGPSLTGVYLVRGHVIHALPPVLSLPGGGRLSRDLLIMAVFALVMAAAGAAMLMHGSRLRSARTAPDLTGPSPGPGGAARSRIFQGIRLGVAGFLAGALTGFVGAGGGFLIVPSLVLLAGFAMETAVGTSLALIAAQALAGFAADWSRMASIDWAFLAEFTLLSAVGAAVGRRFARRLDPAKLRAAFGVFLILLAAAIAAKEFFERGIP